MNPCDWIVNAWGGDHSDDACPANDGALSDQPNADVAHKAKGINTANAFFISFSSFMFEGRLP